MLSLGLTKGSDYFLKNTFILNLNRFLTEDDMFSNFSKSTRRNIRIAEKKGILTHLYEYDNTNESNNESHVETFLSIQRTTVKRHNFAVHPDDYYKTLFKVFKNNMIFLEAEYQGEIIASIVLFVWKDKCYYPYGASLHKYIETKSANLLLYTALKYAYNKKLSSFNFWGALTNKNAMNEKNPLYGVHMFKKGYGGELNEYIGAYDLVINPYIYYGLNLLHRIRGIIRKWKRVLER